MSFTKVERDSEPKPCITLIGMAGAGKSTLAPLLAKALGWVHMDTDRHLEAFYGRPLQDIYDTYGHEEFLRIEERLVSEISLFRTVISTGGSVVYGAEAVTRLKELGPVVFLEIDAETFQKRVGDAEGRGLAVAPGKTMLDVFEERQPLYREAADVIVRTDRCTPDECVQEILEQVDIS
ncbi:homoserine kinase [Salidesulfovibrio brasiliensis]|uniref:homoserine kinase n=1 Tax=Salidesulfovibrio brasiliensis TaxID=221711 RepID=UPI0006D231CB|nr:homoserine kinase [Salidesulfovibrio brasiliensis]